MGDILSEFGLAWVGALFLAAAVVWEALHLFHPDLLRRRRKKILTRLLGDKRFPGGRPFGELQRRIGMKKATADCRELLVEVGAERIQRTDGTEGWRMPRREKT